MRSLTYEQWTKEGTDKFGPDPSTWRFVCPACGHVQCFNDFLPHITPEAARKMIAFSCVGRVDGHMNTDMGKGQPCNYAGGGLFRLNPVEVTFENGHKESFFEFAE